MASIWEKAISILAGNLNSGRRYLITAVTLIYFGARLSSPQYYSPLPTLGFSYLPTALINSASRVRYYNNKEIQIVKPNGVHRVHICGFQKEKEVR